MRTTDFCGLRMRCKDIVNAAYQFDLDQRGWGPPNIYERLLLLKLVLVGGMLMLATINRFQLTPRLAGQGAMTGVATARSALRWSISLEFALAMAVLALVAWLGALYPSP